MKAQFLSSLDHLHEMLAFVRHQTKEMGFENVVDLIELAVEEALVNIIKHGYGDKEGSIAIECAPVEGAGIKVELRDQGMPCNPLDNQKNIDPSLPLESKPVGGYGVFLMTQLMDKVDYRREENSNVLTLVKFTTREQKQAPFMAD